MYFILKIIDGETITQTINTSSCIIGRSTKCDIVVPHEAMSRRHCLIELIKGQFFVTDLESTNGVFIDGKRIPVGAKTPYQPFLSLAFGAVQSLQIEMEQTRSSIVLPDGLNQSSVRETGLNHTSITSTKTKTTTTKSLYPSIQARKDKVQKMKFWATNLLGVLILGLAIYWYYGENKEVVEEYIPVMKEKPSNTVTTD